MTYPLLGLILVGAFLREEIEVLGRFAAWQRRRGPVRMPGRHTRRHPARPLREPGPDPDIAKACEFLRLMSGGGTT